MAIAHDAATQTNIFATSPVNTTHTPVGTPRGVAVVIVHNGASDEISGVTYGGVAMARIRREVHATGEVGTVYLYFLGSGIPTGAQTVAISFSGVGGAKWGVISTVTAAADTANDVDNGASSDSLANPSLTLATTAGVNTAIYYGIHSGLAAPVTTVETGSTHQFGHDFGAASGMWASKTASGGSTTIGYTAAAEDVCHAALAIKESSAPASLVIPRRAQRRHLLNR